MIFAKYPSTIIINQLHTNHKGVVLLLRPGGNHKTSLSEPEEAARAKGIPVGDLVASKDCGHGQTSPSSVLRDSKGRKEAAMLS